jgi:hypothetical protein
MAGERLSFRAKGSLMKMRHTVPKIKHECHLCGAEIPARTQSTVIERGERGRTYSTFAFFHDDCYRLARSYYGDGADLINLDKEEICDYVRDTLSMYGKEIPEYLQDGVTDMVKIMDRKNTSNELADGEWKTPDECWD